MEGIASIHYDMNIDRLIKLQKRNKHIKQQIKTARFFIILKMLHFSFKKLALFFLKKYFVFDVIGCQYEKMTELPEVIVRFIQL